MNERIIPRGPIKIGLDTSFLLQIFRKSIDIDNLKESFFPNKSVFFYAHKNKTEFIGVLIHKLGKNVSEANSAWESLSKNLNMNLIKWDRSIDKDYIPKVRNVNEILAKKRDVPGFQKTIKIGEGDIEIIASFMKEGVDRIYTSDDGFYITCKGLGLNIIKVFPSRYTKMKTEDKEYLEWKEQLKRAEEEN